MSDVFTKEERSKIMSLVKSADTVPERRLRSVLHGRGFRFRLHQNVLPGTPDLVLRKYRVVIFVHGCFWHGHECKRVKRPKTNSGYWDKKLNNNKKRDQDNISALISLNWRVAVVWECSLKKKHLEATLNALTKWIRSCEREFIQLGENKIGAI